MEQEINVQDIENQKPMELATGQGISRFQNVLRDDAILANENLQKVVEKSQGVEGNIEKLLTDIAGEGAFRSSVEGVAGIPKTQQRLNELARLSSVETQQLQKDILGNELQAMGTMETRGFLDARDARANRESAIRSLTIASEAELLQGNLEQAQALVDKAVSAKFEPMKQELEIRKFNLDRLDKTQLEPAQKAQAEATKRKLDAQMKEVETQEELLRTITTNQAPSDIRDKAMKAESLKELYAIPGIEKYFMSPAERLDLQLKGLQVQKLQDEISTINPDAGELVKIGGQDYIRYKDGTISDPILPGAKDLSLVSSRLTDKINTLENLTKPSVGIATSAGSLRGAPIPFLAKGKINDWRADVINTVQKLTVDELGRVKSDGVTFGALSNGERQAVGDAATALSAAMIYTGSGDDRRPTGKFKMSEKKVIEELQKIQDAYKLDFERRVGVQYDLYKKNPSILNDKIADDLVDSVAPLLQETNYGSYPIN